MAQMQVFVSHSHEDDAFCRAVVAGLRGAGADVWYDEHNMGSGQLIDTIERELRARPVFVLVLSPAALRSQWVRDETTWAYLRYKRDPTRIMLPVLATSLADEDDIWMFMQNFKRIEAAGLKPYPTAEAVHRLLLALALTPAGEAPAPSVPQPTESVADLLERGKALMAQQRYAEALPLFERMIQFNASSFDGWLNLGYALNKLGRYDEAMSTLDHAIALSPTSARAWNYKGNAFYGLNRVGEALAAHEHSLSLDPSYVSAWNNKGNELRELKRYEEALAAHEHCLNLDPNFVLAWNNKGNDLFESKRYEEALAAHEQALTLDPSFVRAWNNKGNDLRNLKRYEEALAAHEQALALDPGFTRAWNNKGNDLFELKRYEEALAAYEQALSIEETTDRWSKKAKTLRALNRTTDAEAADRRAKALGG